MAAPTVVPLLPGQAFQALGRGRQSLTKDPSQGPALSGVRGSIDLLILTGAAGTARTVCFLTDNLTTPTRFLAVKIDTSNRPRVVFTDNLGTIVGSVTPSYGAIAASQTVTVRFTWDSTAPVMSGSARFASLRVNRELVPEANWATDPAAAWASFCPTHLMLGGSLSDADFNGTVQLLQASNVVTP
jgi:hypothetical protein